jgi:hypothetical protein
MSRKDRQLIIDELVEFEKYPLEVGDFKRITGHFRRLYKIYLK